MIYVRRGDQRRHIQTAGQNSYLTFDPENRDDPFRGGFRSLVALNEEAPFPSMKLNAHTEDSLEFLTYVRKGALLDWSSFGRQARIHTEEFHHTNSNRKFRHQFINDSVQNSAHIFQCWITPDGRDGARGAERHRFPRADRKGALQLVASSDGENGSLRISQDVQVYTSVLLAGHHLVLEIGEERAAWLHIVEGRVTLQEHTLATGDAAGFEDERSVSLTAQAPSEILLFNLA